MGYLPSDGFRKGKYARAGCPFGEMAAGRGWVRSAHFALAGWKNPPNSLNGVFPRILILLNDVCSEFHGSVNVDLNVRAN